MNKIMLATGMMVGYAYGIEFFIAWYTGNPYERFAFINRAFGPYCVGVLDHGQLQRDLPQFFWIKRLRTQHPGHVRALHLREHRHVVRAFRDHRDVAAPRFLPSSWGYYQPTSVDMLTFVGTFGLFLTLFLLFFRFLPVIALSEVKGMMANESMHR